MRRMLWCLSIPRSWQNCYIALYRATLVCVAFYAQPVPNALRNVIPDWTRTCRYSANIVTLHEAESKVPNPPKLHCNAESAFVITGPDQASNETIHVLIIQHAGINSLPLAHGQLHPSRILPCGGAGDVCLVLPPSNYGNETGLQKSITSLHKLH